MRQSPTPSTRLSRLQPVQCVMLAASLLFAMGLSGSFAGAQAPSKSQPAKTQPHKMKTRGHRVAKKQPAPEPVAQTPAPPPMPHWPANDTPNPASVVWDANGLHINASNSSLQQILSEVSTETGTKVEGTVPDQRVYGSYGPGDARDVLSQLLQGSGYNILLAGDLGKGAPREIVLSPRRSAGTANNMQNANVNRPQQDPDDEIPEQPEDQPQPQVQQPQMPSEIRPGFGPNGPVRTPQQVMEEMQQRQLLQQQQMQQQQQENPQ